MEGKRLPDAVFGEEGPGWEAWDHGRAAPGSYMLVDYDGRRELYIVDPAGKIGRILTHTITVHEDETVTVSPSILDPQGWHGWLERGVWRSA